MIMVVTGAWFVCVRASRFYKHLTDCQSEFYHENNIDSRREPAINPL
jgi:hypothetical protein